MGTGTIVIGLASVIIGEVLFGTHPALKTASSALCWALSFIVCYCRCTADGNAAKRSEVTAILVAFALSAAY